MVNVVFLKRASLTWREVIMRLHWRHKKMLHSVAPTGCEGGFVAVFSYESQWRNDNLTLTFTSNARQSPPYKSPNMWRVFTHWDQWKTAQLQSHAVITILRLRPDVRRSFKPVSTLNSYLTCSGGWACISAATAGSCLFIFWFSERTERECNTNCQQAAQFGRSRCSHS